MSWRLASAVCRGRLHQRQNLPCQDACLAWCDQDGAICLLADGAGSASQARLGAKQAVAAGLDFLVLADLNNDWTDLAHDLVRTLQHKLQQTAQENDCSLRDLHCTLQAVVATPKRWAGLQIGDGFVVYQQDQRWQCLAGAEQDGYLNETHFITQDDSWDHATLLELPQPPTAWCCSSDGLEHLALQQPGHCPFPGFFNPLQQFINSTNHRKDADAELETWLSSEAVQSRTDDDCSLIVASRSEP